jgi:hypothetical protein
MHRLISLIVLSLAIPAGAADISARRALNSSVPDLRLDNVSLADAIDFLRDVTDANVHVNWRALEESGVGRDVTINLRLRRVPLRKVLAMVLAEAGGGNLLTFYIDENVIEITTRELADEKMFTRVYPIEDLIMEVPDFDNAPQIQFQATQVGGGGSGQQLFNTPGDTQTLTKAERAQQIIDTIQQTTRPEIWTTKGGRAAIRFFNGSLIITAPRSVHEALGGYIE